MDYEFVKRICCKGCETVPCFRCDRQLCPTSGHRQVYRADDDHDYNNYCYECITIKNKDVSIEELEQTIKSMQMSIDVLQRMVLKFGALLKEHGIEHDEDFVYCLKLE